ncbi:MAG: glycosyl hydrolase, partial [Candidatus Aminicenantes bacterium]|nr:glycosyl hydrolase [Candidatus Aminicenantes bacterium]
WEWKKDPRVSASLEDLQAQFDLLIKIRDKLSEVNQGIIKLRSAKKQLQAYLQKIKGLPTVEEVQKEGQAIIKHLQAIEDELIQSKSKSPQDPLNYPILLDNKIAALAGVVASTDDRPTDQAVVLFNELAAQADQQLKKLKVIFTEEIKAFNQKIKQAGIPAIILRD